MKPIYFFTALALSHMSLTACWVPQVIQGVRPEIFKSAPAAPPNEYQITREEGLIALATRMISIAKEAARMMAIVRDISIRRQQVENFIYFNVKNTNSSGLPHWFFNGRDYTHYDPLHRSNYTLSFKDTTNTPYPFDVLAISSYGHPPLPAKTFPADFSHYELSVVQTPDNGVGTLSLTLRAEMPRQVGLRGSFETILSGSGENTGHPVLNTVYLNFNGKVSMDGTVMEGQMSFNTVFQGKPYNGFGVLDNLGFKDQLEIQQNGQGIMQIRRVDRRWEVLMGQQVVAMGD